MVRLGLQLTLRSGREALVRLAVTVVAVALGVTVLLSVFADFHAFQQTSGRACWECTVPASSHPAKASTELWDYSETIYQGHFIEVLGVAPLGADAPVLPGLTQLPKAGTYYASPALAGLIARVPADELGDRFPGHLSGTVGAAALSGPSAMVAVVGYTPAKLATLAGTVTVDHIATEPQTQGTTNLYRLAFGIGAIIVLFPLIVLIGTATRLSAARREERFAAMRLVGATPVQVNKVASVEAALSGLFGAMLGCGLFLALRPLLARISFSGQRFFFQYVTPTLAGYALLVVAVPIGSAAAAFWSLRRVRISPLGVSRRTTPPPPKAWRALPLAVGIPLFVVPLANLNGAGNVQKSDLAPVFIGLLLIMLGLVMAGTWLTLQAARVLGRLARGASALLASRRMTDNPKASFRTVAGLVLAVFIASLVATVVPAFSAAESRLGGAQSLADVVRAPYDTGATSGLAPAPAAKLMSQLSRSPGVALVPIYANPGFDPKFFTPPSRPPPPVPPVSGSQPKLTVLARHGAESNLAPPTSTYGSYNNVVTCATLAEMPVLGHCRAGVKYVYADLGNVLLTDNPLEVAKNLPAVTSSNPTAPAPDGRMAVADLLVKTTGAAQVERVRTLLTLYNTSVPNGAGLGAGAGGGYGLAGSGDLTEWQMGDLEPETFGELAQIRNDDLQNIEDVVLAIVGLTLLVAACSLAVTVGGGIMERRRPFTLLRVSGTSSRALRAVVMIEAMLPLLSASVLAAAVGVGVAVPLVRAIPGVQKEAASAAPGGAYYLFLGIGLVVAMLVVSSALPLLGRVTRTEDARFE